MTKKQKIEKIPFSSLPIAEGEFIDGMFFIKENKESKAKEIRESKYKLESDIKLLIEKFIEENGFCDISIDVTQKFIRFDNGQKELTSLSVDITLGI